MGYCIALIDQEFRIDSWEKPYALMDIIQLMYDEDADRGGYNSVDGDVFSWMHHADPSSWDRLVDALSAWRFDPELDDEGNVVGLTFTGQKIGDEKQMFEQIAEYVEPGSYLKFEGEDGRKYKYVFDGEELRVREHEEIQVTVASETIDDVIETLESPYREMGDDGEGLVYLRSDIDHVLDELNGFVDREEM